MALTDKSASRKDAGKMAELQHRHFATIATIISKLDYAGVDPDEVREGIAEHFARYLAETNAKFDRARFLRACSVDANTTPLKEVVKEGIRERRRAERLNDVVDET